MSFCKNGNNSLKNFKKTHVDRRMLRCDVKCHDKCMLESRIKCHIVCLDVC